MGRRVCRDDNHPLLSRAFEQMDWSVVDLAAVGGGVPDVVVSGVMRGGPLLGTKQTFHVEYKAELGKLRASQVEWRKAHRGVAYVVRGVEDVIALVEGRLEPWE